MKLYELGKEDVKNLMKTNPRIVDKYLEKAEIMESEGNLTGAE